MTIMSYLDRPETLQEFSIGPAQLDRASGILRGTTVITSRSQNGQGKGGRRYSEAALKQIAAMAEGAPAYANHVEASMAFRPRDVRDLLGVHRNVRYLPHEGKVVSDLHVMEHMQPMVFGLAAQLGDRIGNSLVSRGLVAQEGDCEVVKEIQAVRSVDLVSDPAATRGLFESAMDFDASPADRVARLRAAFEGVAYERPDLRARRIALVEAISRDVPVAALLDNDEYIPEDSHARLTAALSHGRRREPLPPGIHARVARGWTSEWFSEDVHARLVRATER